MWPKLEPQMFLVMLIMLTIVFSFAHFTNLPVSTDVFIATEVARFCPSLIPTATMATNNLSGNFIRNCLQVPSAVIMTFDLSSVIFGVV